MSNKRAYLVRAARVHTLDPLRPEAECVCVEGERIAAVGTFSEVADAVGGGIELLDLRPAILVPGLTDSHIHLIEWAVGRSRPDLSGVDSMEEALARVDATTRSSASDAWLEFKGWNPGWRSEKGLAALDSASHQRAVALIAHDLHSGWLNSEAMRRLGIGPDRSDPPGGVVERDDRGRPSGVLRERALDWWYEGRPRSDEATRRALMLEGQAALHRLGVTAVHSVEAPESFRVVDGAVRSGDLQLRVLHHMPQRFLDALLDCGIASGFGNDWLRVGGIKYFTDGALGSRTAWMLEPYTDGSGRGVRRLDPEEFCADVRRAVEGGLAATVHAIGDAAIRMTLGCLEGAGSGGLAIPHRIEHLQCFNPEDLGRVGKGGIVASMQPSHMLTDIRLVEERWGQVRERTTYALRSLLDSGTVLAFGSDAPVEAADPREGFYAALARRDRDDYPQGGWHPEERLTGLEVLHAYTVGPAVAAGDAERRGRLSPGYFADFAAWNVDLATADPEAILEAQVVATVVGGEIVFQR